MTNVDDADSEIDFTVDPSVVLELDTDACWEGWNVVRVSTGEILATVHPWDEDDDLSSKRWDLIRTMVLSTRLAEAIRKIQAAALVTDLCDEDPMEAAIGNAMAILSYATDSEDGQPQPSKGTSCAALSPNERACLPLWLTALSYGHHPLRPRAKQQPQGVSAAAHQRWSGGGTDREDVTMTDTIYEPAYSPSQEARMARLHPSAKPAFAEMLAVLLKAEDAGGPEGSEYMELMEAIIEEAVERRDYCRDHTMG